MSCVRKGFVLVDGGMVVPRLEIEAMATTVASGGNRVRPRYVGINGINNEFACFPKAKPFGAKGLGLVERKMENVLARKIGHIHTHASGAFSRFTAVTVADADGSVYFKPTVEKGAAKGWVKMVVTAFTGDKHLIVSARVCVCVCSLV
ncbi:Usp family protein [Anopheles sinensis]|uniref:Usp family protein n=1 Tax=Anopheles sinensis TaxID=74873 RepID=A0A084WG17_ANOSI|nr:Usp family protein [Anopheles sinensis]